MNGAPGTRDSAKMGQAVWMGFRGVGAGKGWWVGEKCGRALHDAHLSAIRLREDGAPGIRRRWGNRDSAKMGEQGIQNGWTVRVSWAT